MRHGVMLSKKQSPKTDKELKKMLDIPYASAVGSIQYVAQYTRPNIAYALSVTSRYQAGELILEGFSDAGFQSDDDDVKSQSRFVFKLNGGVVAWKSSNTSPHRLSGGVLIFRGSPDRDLGSRRPTESTLEAKLEFNNDIIFSKLLREEHCAATTPPNTRSSLGASSFGDKREKRSVAAQYGSSSKRPRPSSSATPPPPPSPLKDYGGGSSHSLPLQLWQYDHLMLDSEGEAASFRATDILKGAATSLNRCLLSSESREDLDRMLSLVLAKAVTLRGELLSCLASESGES
ncbi:Retrovirus-related Pol polyprotein from transposon TNT 1-94 [Sesamum angolense]|uniref:Retrovirus-related Pol polyprotein from transposon TNT 1-94 n=1 Tax=Sesamum angolense TaxID=2727404 RepID=A0AAE1XAI9_9LAMI|nr:Retrovirus-related Pol polyprotein from transposon TNT 1-94 [Sesamum angolense]